MTTYEVNLDGLVGSTHHYAGLAVGNLASMQHAQRVSNPRAAALQGLAKMRLLHAMGLKQGILPPHPRPNLRLLHTLGFTGTPAQQVWKAHKQAPHLLSAAYSAASMWSANAATVSSSVDTEDHRVHITVANVLSHLHRHQEAAFNHFLFKQIFPDSDHFIHHDILPGSILFSDEGAANHMRLCNRFAQPGINIFVYGTNKAEPMHTRFPCRQTRQASEALARSHTLDRNHTFFIQQHPDAINAGVFHNDVLAMSNENLLLVHEKAWVNQPAVLHALREQTVCDLHLIEIKNDELSLSEAVDTYLFNAQLVTLPDGTMTLIAPIECAKNNHANALIKRWVADKTCPLSRVDFVDLKQSMQNGGGPACLRLRLPLTHTQYQTMHHGVCVTELLLDTLTQWVNRHYRETLHPDDLADPLLINESRDAVDTLYRSILMLALP